MGREGSGGSVAHVIIMLALPICITYVLIGLDGNTIRRLYHVV